MGNGLVGKGELTEVVAEHFRLDLDVDEDLAVVDASDGTDHLGEDDHGAEVGLDGFGLLTVLETDLGLAHLLEEAGNLENTKVQNFKNGIIIYLRSNSFNNQVYLRFNLE